MASTEAQKTFNKTVEFIQTNPFGDRRELLARFMDAALDVWNEDIAGDVELSDGSFVTIQPIIHKGY